MTIRVLALCGFTQNANIYSRQLGAIRKLCKDVEFVFLEPPIVVEKADMPWNRNLSEFDSTATTDESAQTPETMPRAWWLIAEDWKVFARFDETLRYIHDFMVKSAPFDGIMGFSQGACMAAILAALLEKPGLHPAWSSEPALPQFKFVISVGGFLPSATSPSFQDYFPLPASLPTLHVVGRNDTLVTLERSQTLIDKCENARVEFHEGGHFTPSKSSWRHFFNAYISSFAEGGSQGDVGTPSSFCPSGPNSPVESGASTPQSVNPPPWK